MRYWACINNQVLGPFEKEKLSGVSGFTVATLICPETPAAGETAAWKAASVYPEVTAALNPAPPPEQPRKPAAESPLMMTMRGTIIEEPPAAPAPAEAPEKAPAAVPPPGVSAPELFTPQGAGSQPDPLKEKLDHMSAMLVSLGNSQSQVLERLNRLESAVLEMKSLLFPAPPAK